MQKRSLKVSLSRIFFVFFKQWLVLGAEPRTDAHDRKGDPIEGLGRLSEDQQGEQSADEWRNGIVGAGACRSQQTLGVYVEKDAQTVRDESYAQHGGNAPRRGDAISHAEADDHRAKPRKDPLQQYDLQGIL